jgi:tetratricopeptide (TPR) repeat protein
VLTDRHADYFIAVAEATTRGAPDGDAERTRRLYPEVDNFRRALEWLVASGDAERELRLATGAFWCLWTHSSLRELHGWLASALERAANADAYPRGEALGAAALAAANLGEAEVARAYARESLVLASERDDKRQIEWALRVLSFDEPDLAERRRLLYECERLLLELGNETGLAWVTYLRGMTFVDEGSFDVARGTLEQAVALFRELGRRWEATNAEILVGYTLVASGRHGEARLLLEGALANAVDLASPGSIMQALVLLAAVRMEADAAAATRLMAAVRMMAHEKGFELDLRFEGRVLETTARSTRERLGQRFETEWEAGSRLTLEETVALALDKE